jgi:hypothetical protein
VFAVRSWKQSRPFKGDPALIRDDLSEKLIHLTRGETDQTAADIFVSILRERQLRGGTGCIKGRYQCICFSEAPVSKLAQILANPSAHGMRYKPFGVMIEKKWLFARGGRPVIYQSDREFKLLHEEQRFRHVRYEPEAEVDFTWEREWRIQTDMLNIEPTVATLIVPTRAWERWAQDQHTAMLSRQALLTHGFIGPSSVAQFPWHFMVLEDIGVSVPGVEPPPLT